MMNIFTDFHHTSLYQSLHLLFEKRLGHTLYRPIGMEWFDKKIWKIADVYPNPRDTAQQYLTLASNHAIDKGNYYSCYEDIPYHAPHKALTYEQFLSTDIDIIISSVPQHWDSFRELNKVKPKAKQVNHIGNGGSGWDVCPAKNIITSVPIELVKLRPDQRIVFCNQEFDRSIFSPTSATSNKWITAFAHCQPARNLWEQYKDALKDYKFSYHGQATDNGCLPTIQDVADKMHQSMWGWCVKPSDGYGHIIHNFLSCGRPVIVRKSTDYPYRDYLIPGENCIDLNAHSFEQNVELIREASTPEVYNRMHKQTVELFNKYIDFGADAERVRAFIGGMESCQL